MAPALTLWKLEPAARIDDSAWQDRDVYRMIVRAGSATEARLLASRRFKPADDPEALERADLGGGFLSEKLYWVVPLEPAEAEGYGDGPAGVVEAELLARNAGPDTRIGSANPKDQKPPTGS